MKILSIETSCDETAVSIVEAEGGLDSPSFKVLGNALFSQIAIHKEYGGVYPMLAKREHAKNLAPLLEKSLKDAGLLKNQQNNHTEEFWKDVENILSREEGLFPALKETFKDIDKPNIDAISVTSGPGLEPALWVGISFATALGKLWNIPVIGVNHMEGHIASVLIENIDERKVEFPALAVLISGGHTEIVKINSWGKYKVIGQTVDDAVGEAFDKVARLLGLPYPGGPEISRLAEKAREENLPHTAKLPRPMLHSNNLNFSFSGLKTAVLYYIRDHFSGSFENMNEENKSDLAREFEDAVIDVLREKTNEALKENNVKTLIVGGGVIANKKLKDVFIDFENKYSGLVVKIPTRGLATDNSLMIAVAAYINTCLYPEILTNTKKIIAKGNLGFE
ncbi:MAG: O-sialoglycoprotein endopeptidase [Parcubacteria bacterium C7867-006]|nr:MAG: O-sialoglycoprotein endopeptidase [Parcubacteria bacterium C7867-006]